MANQINALSSNATLADVIAAVTSSRMSDAVKLQFLAKASDPQHFEEMRVALNYYLADSAEEYDGDGSDIEYDELAVKAAKEKEEAERKALREKQEAERRDKAMNAAAHNLMLRGVKMFVGGAINPQYQKLLNEEIDILLKSKRIYTMDTGECFVPDMNMTGLTAKQKAAIEKAEIEDCKSNKVISNEDRRPMQNGEHLVKIVFYQERKGRDGKPNYAIINCVEEKTGKRVWLPQWVLSDPMSVDKSDMWKCRLNQLKSISENNNDIIEGMTEDDAVEFLRNHEFRVFTYLKSDGNMAVYLDADRYAKYLERTAKAEEKVEEAAKRDAELDAIGLKNVEPDESIDAQSWKF